MNIDNLRYFSDLAKTNSINATAKRMFISQQSLSESIKRLEQELNCTLVIRSRTGVQFTEDGKMLLDCAQNILSQHNRMEQYLQTKYNRSYLHGTLIIGVAPLATSTILPKLLLHMHQIYPDITLVAYENSTSLILRQIAEGEMDFGLFGTFQTSAAQLDDTTFADSALLDTLHFVKLYTDRPVCVMSPNHPLSIHKSLTLEQLNHVKKTVHGYNMTDNVASSCIHLSAHAEIHQQFMRVNGTVCYMPYQTYLSLYAPKDFVSIPISDAPDITNYLVCKKRTLKENELLYRTFIDTALSLMPE